MPVIINEFEVVVDEPEPAPDTRLPMPAEQVEREPVELTPEAVERILEFFAERRARLLAD